MKIHERRIDTKLEYNLDDIILPLICNNIQYYLDKIIVDLNIKLNIDIDINLLRLILLSIITFIFILISI